MSATLAGADLGATTAAVTTVLGLFGGAVGGVVAAGQIARRSAKAKDRYESMTTLRGVLSTYRARLAYERAEAASNSVYPKSYADPAGQEELTLAVLRELPHLNRRLAVTMCTGLQQLVGTVTLGFAEGRLYVPAARLDPDSEKQRLGLLLSKVLFDGESMAKSYGLLGELLRSQNAPEKRELDYEAAMAALASLLKEIRP